MIRILAAALALAGMLAGQGHALAQGKMYANEDKDWNVSPPATYRRADYHSPTPRELPGGKVVMTEDLKAVLAKDGAPYIIDVLGGGIHTTVRGAFWLGGAGAGDMSADEEKRFASALAKFAAGDKGKALVFFCSDAECWLSYNAAMRAVKAGYTNILWYRGGIQSWMDAGFPTTFSDPFAW
jgi:PQQ-dependent catabolism-associated CXXCW motif protein